MYSNVRRHYKTSNKPSRSLPGSVEGRGHKRALIFVSATLFFLYFFLSPNNKESRIRKLKHQPTYTRHESACSATLCNSAERCSIWKPNQVYTWPDLSEARVFRDLALIELTKGCQLRIRIENSIDDSEWLTIPEGTTECSDSEIMCQNLAEIDLRTNALILAKEVQNQMKERKNQNKEIILVQSAIKEVQNKETDITLISQFTVNRLDTFAKAIEVWEGPISVAIYLTNPTDIEDLILYFEDEEHLSLYARVTITIVKPNYLDNMHLAYPINHLRNLAITESTTDFLFVIDADFTPSKNLYTLARSQVIPYAIYNSDSMPPTAWVVPCFAIRQQYADLPLPKDYDELRRLVGKDIAYITDPGAGHGPTLATQIAMVRPLIMGDPLAYEVCYESQWEPYYIVHRSAPLYDARFKNQGGDKQSHALHLNAEGYRFMVLRQAFMTHKDHPSFVWPNGGFEKSQRATTNWNYFVEFMQEIEYLYGKSARWPRGCSATAIGWQDQRRGTIGLAAGAA
ncbi:glycosyl-transferase for dystroglycan-domain-containing protein [Choanephora cucurbitarum]|nr:glycosyl-transferase for dystroglycan-domain-containing protein [Choanephora cucurbitarum]